jgi:hypothetical protein
MAYEKAAMTSFAQQALVVSDLIQMKFKSTRLGGSVPRVVKVQAPIVESTGGGKQARESIVLTPENGDNNGAIVCGFVDVGLRAAELRTHAALANTYQQRFKTPLDLSQSDYDRFMEEAQQFLGSEGFVVNVIDEGAQAAKASRADEPQARAANPMGMYIGIGVAVLIALAGVGLFVLK